MSRLLVFALLTAVMPLFAQEVNVAGERFPQVALPKTARAAEVIGALGGRLPEVARWYGKTPEEFRALVQRDRALMMDRSGHLAYACAGLVPTEEDLANAEAVEAAANEPRGIVYPPAQTFFLHSRPGSNRKIYLDFNGHTTSGTIWNTNINGGNSFTTPPYDIDGNPAAFSSTELSRIQGIWKRVAEDFAPFDVDVTTEDPGVEALRRSPASDQAYGIRVCIGGSSYDWYNRGAGGVAYVGSFNWTNDTPTFVFTAQLGNGNEKNTAEATSHEVGHTLGLNHDGQTDGTEYYGGHGNWAPIMGVGYGKAIVQWSQGEYPLANNTQNDTSVMQNFGAPLRPDSEGAGLLTAVPVTGPIIALEGVISTRADVDYFRFSTGAGLISFSTTSPSASPNLHVLLTLYDVTGVAIASSDPATMSGSLSATVAAGTYYIAVEGTAPGNPLTNYNDYGSLGGYELNGTVRSTEENFVTVVASDPEAAETAPPSGGVSQPPNTGTFAITRLVVDEFPLTVPFTIGGTATHGTDYVMPTTITIPARQSTAFLTVAPVDDLISEGSESVIVTVQPGTGYKLGAGTQATVQIRDNDLPQVSILAPPTPQISENSASPLKLTLVRSFKAPTSVTVPLIISGTAEPGVDYEPLPESVTIPAGEDRREISVQPLDDTIFNQTRTVTVTVGPDPEYIVGFQGAATVRILNDEAPPDANNPSVTISSPKAKLRVNAPVTSLVATGTASDNLGVAKVHYRLNGGAWNLATLSPGSWTADITTEVVAGNNVLEAKAEDDDGNASTILAVGFAVVQPRTFAVVVKGPGKVSPGNGKLEAGQVYTLSAKPQAGKIFAGWTGDISGARKVLPFTMPDADVEVTATFVDNPFSTGVIGKYSGLLTGLEPVPETAGLLAISVTPTGVATGKVWIGGRAFRLKGEFNATGRLEAEIVVKKAPKIPVALDLDLNPDGSQSITGTIGSGGSISNVLARRSAYHAKKNPLGAAFAQKFTFHLPPPVPAPPPPGPGSQDSSLPDGDDTAPKPQGHGTGIMSISTAGVVKWVGTLADGSPAVQSTLLDAQHRWPLYLSLYQGQGYMAGDVLHDPAAADSDLSANVRWVKRPNPSEPYFPGGFRLLNHPLVGVNYIAPRKSERVLTGYDSAPQNAGPLLFQEGNLNSSGLAGVLSLLPTNKTVLTSSLEKLTLGINPKTGAVTGSFIFPLTRKVTPIRGVILQGKIGKGVGYFPGSTLNSTALRTGRVEFAPDIP